MTAIRDARTAAVRATLVVALASVAVPLASSAETPACAGDTVCNQSDSPPAEDWFRQGLEALAVSESQVAACALEKASRLDPKEDGRNLSTFVKPMREEIKAPLRECTQSSAPLDKKKYFPRLYLAKAYLDWALRSPETEKKVVCEKALQALAGSRASAPIARVQQQWERKEKIDRALTDSRCCDLFPDDPQCSTQIGSAG